MRLFIVGVIGVAVQVSLAIKYLRNPITAWRFGVVSSGLHGNRVPDVSIKSESVLSIKNSTNTDAEMYSVLSNALNLVKLPSKGIQSQGWNAVHESPTFSLYKRLKNRLVSEEDGPMEYLMMGEFKDVSPAVLLKMQVEKDHRK